MEFRSALLYSRDNYAYQLNLAEALIGLKRTSEASTYLVNLWDRQPEDGLVNLSLARIAVHRGQTEQALRYYHNAIYAAWPNDQETKRRDARLELIQFLLATNAKAQAQSELIALEENMGEDPTVQQRVGDLFLRVPDYEHALAAYRLSSKGEGDNRAALAGAGFAAFQLGRYPVAARFLQSPVKADSSDKRSAELLKTAETVLRMDPFQRRISVAQATGLWWNFSTAGERRNSCGVARGVSLRASVEPIRKLGEVEADINLGDLRRDPDLGVGDEPCV
jgi:predicted Zn-dependent protease